MKFLKSEYDDLMKAISEEGFEQVNFAFVKKKGMLHIQMNSSNDSFCFFRKKESVMNSKDKFEDKLTYYTGPKKVEMVKGWPGVMEQFKEFVQNGA